MTNGPFLGGSMDTRNIISFASCQEYCCSLLQLFIVRPKLIFTFHWQKQQINVSNFFPHVFRIFTHQPWYQVRYFSLCLSHCLEQIPWVCPHGPAKSFPKLSKSPPPRGKKINTKTVPFPLGSVGSPGMYISKVSTHGEANDKCINFN